jgi:hypothetical protein
MNDHRRIFRKEIQSKNPTDVRSAFEGKPIYTTILNIGEKYHSNDAGRCTNTFRNRNRTALLSPDDTELQMLYLTGTDKNS